MCTLVALFPIYKLLSTTINAIVMWELGCVLVNDFKFKFKLQTIWKSVDFRSERDNNPTPLHHLLKRPNETSAEMLLKWERIEDIGVCFCVCVWWREREDFALKACLFAGKLSVCAAPETSRLPSLHNLVSGPPLISFTAVFPEGLWSDACGVLSCTCHNNYNQARQKHACKYSEPSANTQGRL